MNSDPKGKIVCATRGGEASLVLQAKAIQIAKTEKRGLVFVYVVTLDNLGDIDENLLEAAQSELSWFGNALLGVAELRARRMGVNAETVVREGNVREQIAEVIREKQAAVLVLGQSRQKTSEPIFQEDALPEFARQIERDTGVDVRILSLEND